MKYGAVEGAAMNVRVNAIAPGLVRTPMSELMGEELMEQACRVSHLTKKVIVTKQVQSKVGYFRHAGNEIHVDQYLMYGDTFMKPVPFAVSL